MEKPSPKPKEAPKQNTLSNEQIGEYFELSVKENLDQQTLDLIYSNLEYSKIYMELLNNYRVTNLIIPELMYDQIVLIMRGILTTIQINYINNKNSKINELELHILNYIIILSQTFYKESEQNKDKKGDLLLEQVKLHSIWQYVEIWKTLIKYSFRKELDSQKPIADQSKKDREKMIMEIVLTTFKYNLASFGLTNLEDKILKDYIKKYNLSSIKEIVVE